MAPALFNAGYSILASRLDLGNTRDSSATGLAELIVNQVEALTDQNRIDIIMKLIDDIVCDADELRVTCLVVTDK